MGPDFHDYAITLEKTLPSPARSDEAAPRVALVHGNCQALVDVTQSVLRSRLRITASLLCAVMAAFLIWDLIGLAGGRRDVDLPLTVQLAVVTFALAACAWLLGRCCPISMWKLRVKELVIFGLPAVFIWQVQMWGMHREAAVYLATEAQFVQAAAPESALSEVEVFGSPAPAWLLLVFTYAMFIPSSWRRAAAVLAPLCAGPLLVVLYLGLTDRDSAVALSHDADFVIELALIMLSALAAAVVGVRTIGSLRREAHVGRQLGQYRLIELLGSGGMGEVYLAEHRFMKRPCALKLIRPEKAGDAQALSRFEREVRATARLSHWNSVDIYDYGRTSDGTFYYVMEYLPGMNLQDLVSRHGPLPAGRVIHLLRQACEALREAHTAGIIHRDIKPANIIASQRGGIYDVAKLLDFGLAKPLGDRDEADLTQEGSITGSPLYMSPEQILGDEQIDGRSDIYSLGSVAYYLLTAQPPFRGDRAVKILLAHTSQTPRSLRETHPEVPPDLEQIVLRCLAKRPADRFGDAGELIQALDECAAADSWSHEDAANWWKSNPVQLRDPQPEPAFA